MDQRSAVEIGNLFSSVQFHVVNEVELQSAVAAVLTKRGVPFQTEVRLSPRDRIDFMHGTVGIELKVRGSWESLERQLLRYAASTGVGELLVLSTRFAHTRIVPPMLNGKPLTVVRLKVFA